MKFIIPIHSFVDVITNSSSEIFISAEKSTVKAAIEMIDHLLKSQGVKKTAAELFDIHLEYTLRAGEATGYDDMDFATEEALDAFKKEHEVEDYDEGIRQSSSLVVTALNPKDEELVLAAKALERIATSISAEEVQQ